MTNDPVARLMLDWDHLRAAVEHLNLRVAVQPRKSERAARPAGANVALVPSGLNDTRLSVGRTDVSVAVTFSRARQPKCPASGAVRSVGLACKWRGNGGVPAPGAWSRPLPSSRPRTRCEARSTTARSWWARCSAAD